MFFETDTTQNFISKLNKGEIPTQRECNSFVSNKEHLNDVNFEGRTALYYASEHGCLEIAEMLIEAGADIEATDKGGVTPIIIAAYKGHDNIVQLLIKRGANLNSADRYLQTALVWAVSYRRFESTLALIKAGANINFTCSDGSTALSLAMDKYASDSRMEPVVQCLIENGADPNVATEYGQTPLRIAAMKGYEDIVRQLIIRGADLNNIYIVNKYTALMYAIENGYEGSALALIEAGADINCVNNAGTTALSLAIQKNLEPIVKLLNEKGAR